MSLLQNSRTPTAFLMPEGVVGQPEVLCDAKLAVEFIFRRGSLEVFSFQARRGHALTGTLRFYFRCCQTR